MFFLLDSQTKKQRSGHGEMEMVYNSKFSEGTQDQLGNTCLTTRSQMDETCFFILLRFPNIAEDVQQLYQCLLTWQYQIINKMRCSYDFWLLPKISEYIILLAIVKRT